MFNELFLKQQTAPTVQVDKENHIYRSRHAEHGFVQTPLVPKLNKSESTIDRVWSEVVDSNSYKPVFGYRPLIKVIFLFF